MVLGFIFGMLFLAAIIYVGLVVYCTYKKLNSWSGWSFNDLQWKLQCIIKPSNAGPSSVTGIKYQP